jgi:hypothetical protein
VSWGWNPDSFTAVGTVGASLTALIAILLTLGQSRVQRKRDLAGLADQVFVSVLTKAYRQSKDRYGFVGWELHIHNGGALPIQLGGAIATIEVPALNEDDKRSCPFQDWTTVNFLRERTHYMSVPRVKSETWAVTFSSWPGVIEAGATVDLRAVLTGDRADLPSPAQKFVAISFADANGRWWTRSAVGELGRDRK